MNRKIKLSKLPNLIKAEFLIPLLGVLFFIKPVINNDDWFIFNCGRYIENNGIPHTEVFTMHEGLNTIFQQWLTDVIYWKIYSNFDITGVTVTLFILFFTTSFLCYSLCKKVSDNHFVSSIVSFIMMACIVSSFFSFRPQLLTINVILIELYCLESFMKNQNVKWLIPVPFLSLLEINLHASMWPILFIIMLPYIVDTFNFDFKIIKCAGVKKLPIYITFIVSLFVGFINPYGLDAMTYLFKSYGLPYLSKVINEMVVLDVSKLSELIFAVIFLIIVVVCVWKTAKCHSSVPIRYFLLVLGFGFMMFITVRNEMFFFIGGIFVLAYCFKGFDPSIMVDENENKKKQTALSALIIILILVAGVVFVSTDGVTSSDKDGDNCFSAVNYVADNYDSEKIKVYTGYEDGAYAEYMGLRVYMDPRAELFFKKNNGKEDIFAEYYKLQFGRLNYKEFLNKYDFDVIILAKNDALLAYLPYDNDYKLIYKDEYSTVYDNVNK